MVLKDFYGVRIFFEEKLIKRLIKIGRKIPLKN